MLKFNRVLMIAALSALASAAGAQETKDMDGMKGMDMKDMNMSQPAVKQAQGMGTVKAVDAKAGTVTIAHEPIKALNWPAMTMGFKVTQPAMLDKIAVGQKVEFELENKSSNPRITALKVMK